MSYTAEQLLVLASNFDKLAVESLVKEAKKKEEDSKKPGKKKPFPFWLKKKGPKGSEKDSKKSDTNSAKDSKDSKKPAAKKKKSAYYDTILSKLAQTQFEVEKDKAISAPPTTTSKGSPKQVFDASKKTWTPITAEAYLTLPNGSVLRFFRDKKWNYAHKEADGWKRADPLSLSEISGVEIDFFPTAPPGGSKYPPIDRTFQTMLGVSADGSLGPETQTALDLYKKSLGQENWISNSFLFESLKNEPEFKSKSAMKKDPSTGMYIRSHNVATQEIAGPKSRNLPDPYQDPHATSMDSTSLTDPWDK